MDAGDAQQTLQKTRRGRRQSNRHAKDGFAISGCYTPHEQSEASGMVARLGVRWCVIQLAEAGRHLQAVSSVAFARKIVERDLKPDVSSGFPRDGFAREAPRASPHPNLHWFDELGVQRVHPAEMAPDGR